ncbi:unnamed protein product, partial [Nesidiocoris tenuis]
MNPHHNPASTKAKVTCSKPSQNGRLLLGEVLHEEPVRSISCQCYQPQPNPLVAQVDELHVAHSTVVCCVQGFALCNSLKTCRNQLARIEANCSSKIESTPLTFIKWGLPEQEDIKDVTVLGTASSTVFNHLTTASLRGGYYATYRSGPPQVSTVIATGSFPFVAWHCLLEGSSGPILTDVAKAVASKFVSAIGSAVPGWLGVNKKGSMEKTKEKAHTEPAELMSCSVEIDASAEAIPTTSREDLIFQRLELIRKYFPYSLTIDHLIANVCWEYVSSWAKQLDKTEFLVIGLRCLKLIPDLALKLGKSEWNCERWSISAEFWVLIVLGMEIPIEEVSHWIGQCYSLAYDWEINADTLRVQQVINLYKNNGDRFAEE